MGFITSDRSANTGVDGERIVRGLAFGTVALCAFALPTAVQAQTAPTSCGVATDIAINGGFEVPDIARPGRTRALQLDQSRVPGWSTIDPDGLIEIWTSGFSANPSAGTSPVPSDTGEQHAELNAREIASLSQTGIVRGNAELLVTWSHRAREDNDDGSNLTQTATATISDNAGASVDTGTFTADARAWVPHSQLLKTGAGASEFTMTFDAADGGSTTAQGNFLDSVTACQTYLTVSPAVTGRDDVDGSGGDSVGDTVTIEYTISNPTGNLRPLEDVTVQDDLLGPITVSSPTSGDTNGNGILDPGETWVVTRPYVLDQDDLDNAETPGFEVSSTINATGDTTNNVLNTVDAPYSFPVTAPPIAAVDDSATVANRITGDANALNVLTGDTVGSDPATTDNVSIAVAAGSAVPPELTFDPDTGIVGVPANTPAGTYTFRYEICEVSNPANCAQADATVTVAPAADISVTKSNGQDGVMPGETLTYVVTISNAGPDAATGALIIDSPSGNLSCDAADPLTFGGTASDGAPLDNQTIGDLTGSGVTLRTIDIGENVTISYGCTVTQS
ncbi:DUF11 domain-containing protein [Erythrobacter sp.]|nr:DUF11 domain-containing protein [Erythrobacter sp.]